MAKCFFGQACDDPRANMIQPINGSGHYQNMARLYLSYLVQLLFSFQRFPCCDEKVNEISGIPVRDFFLSLTQEDIDAHLRELSRLYNHTQEQLQQVTKDGYIKVSRGTRGKVARYVACAVRYAKERKIDTIPYIANTFDFYSSYPMKENAFNDGVRVVRSIPITELLLSYHTVAGFHRVDADILVVNTHPKGEVTIPVDDIEVDHYAWPSDKEYEYFVDYGHQRYVFDNLFGYLADPYGDKPIVTPHSVWEDRLGRYGRCIGRAVDEFIS